MTTIDFPRNPSVAGDTIAWPRDRAIPPQGQPLPAGTVVVSADSHVLETSDLWLERLPARFKDRAPKLWWDEDGFSHLEAEGRNLDVPGLNTMLVEGRTGITDPVARLRDLDAEGVDKEIIFPQRTLSLVGLQDLELRDACLRALGFHAMEIPSSPPGVFYNSRSMEPLWDAIERSGYPISFHIGENIQTK